MKPLKSLAFAIILLCITNLTYGQKIKTAPDFDTRHKNIYVEFLGSSLLGGVNFDMRLQKGRMDGMGFRAGVGGFHVSGIDQNTEIELGIVSFPLEFNHLVGNRRSSFEAGVGLLPVYANISGEGELTDYEYIEADGFTLAGGYLTLGYRLQPLKNGFMFKVNWNPMLMRGNGFQQGWVGIGIGFGFK